MWLKSVWNFTMKELLTYRSPDVVISYYTLFDFYKCSAFQESEHAESTPSHCPPPHPSLKQRIEEDSLS